MTDPGGSDERVMPQSTPCDTIRDMTVIDRADVLVLDEFRLHVADTYGTAAAIITAASSDRPDPVPLLTSIDDPRDVATLRVVSTGAPDDHGLRGDAALGPLVASWQPTRRYLPRVAERSDGTSSSFRLAVTESGINDEQVAPPGKMGGEPMPGEPVALLLIGIPEGTHAGLLVLIGSEDAGSPSSSRDRAIWPLPLSRDLGVRIYESGERIRPVRA